MTGDIERKKLELLEAILAELQAIRLVLEKQ